MQKKSSPFLRIEDHFGEVRQTPVITVFENRLTESPRFTIAIPTFRRAETLRETLKSALNQDTTEPYEIVVSDNNPERGDETEVLMKEYANVPNLTYIKNSQNLGMTGNWNRLPLMTRGEYMVILHDDDCIAPFFISSAAILLNKYQDIEVLQFSKIHEKKFEFQTEKLIAHRYPLIDNILGNAFSAPTGTIYLVNTVLKLGGWNPENYPSQDYCFDSLLMCQGCKLYISPLKATFYRIGINVSLKKETMAGCIIIDNYLRDILLRRIWIPGFIRSRFLESYNEIKIARMGLTADDIKPILVNKYRGPLKRFSYSFICKVIFYLSRLSHLKNKIFTS